MSAGFSTVILLTSMSVPDTGWSLHGTSPRTVRTDPQRDPGGRAHAGGEHPGGRSVHAAAFDERVGDRVHVGGS
jgi:hypothetical protein